MINKEIGKHDVVIVSDYGHGLISKQLIYYAKNQNFSS